MRTIALDWESFFDSECTITKLGNRGYFNHPKFDPYLLSAVSDDGLRWVGHPCDFDWSLIEGAHVLSHNASFDEGLYLEEVAKGHYPRIAYAAWDCTMDLCSYHGIRRSLKNAVKDLFDVELSKETRDNMQGFDWATMTPEFRKEVEEYALMDAEWCLKVWEKLSPTWPEHERRISRHTRTMCRRGIAIDEPALREAIEHLSEVRFAMEGEVPWVETAKLKSRTAFDLECRKNGLTPPKSLAKSSPEAVAWFEENEPKYPWLAAFRNVGRANSLLLKLQTLERQIHDGRFHPAISYHAAHTGRFSSGGGGFNCLPGDHEVLTPAGWVRLDEWETPAPIAQWSEGRVEFVVAAGKVDQPYDGPMVEVDNPRVRAVMTPDHRVLSTSPKGGAKVVEAARLRTTRTAGIPTGGITTVEDSPLWSDDMLRLMVATAADGSKTKKTFQFGFKRPRKIERMATLLERLGVEYTRKTHANGATRFYLPTASCPNWLHKGFGPWLLGLSARQLNVVLEELVEWDGGRHQVNGACVFYSSVRDQADWVATAAALVDRPTSLRGYAVSGDESKTKWYVYFKEPSSRSEIHPRQVREVRSSGRVFCPQVPSGFFLVRYRGQIHVTGNCQNMPRGYLFGVDMRGLFVAPPGKRFVVVDLAQIEVRTTLWLAGDKDALDEIAKTDDLYEALAIKFGMWSSDRGSLRIGDPALRQGTKVVGLGVLYGASAGKVAQIAGIPVAEAERWVGLVHKTFPKVLKLWDRLINAVTRARNSQDRTCELRLPDGTALRYRNVRYEGNGLVASILKGSGYADMRIWRGAICENLAQKTARNVLVDAILRVEEAGYPVVLHVHDEIIVEVDEGRAEECLADIVRIMRTPPHWAPDIPLDAEGSIMTKYGK